MNKTTRPVRWGKWIHRTKPLIFVLCSLPAGLLVYDFFNHRIGGDPLEHITTVTGTWGLRLLLITLAITPLRFITRINQLILVRRMLGVFSFFYILLHFLTWLVIDKFFDFQAMLADVLDRYYILFGTLAFAMMIPLAVTSTNRMLKWTGGKRWNRLHKLVYPIAILGVLHFYLQVKADVTDPVIYGVILTFLLGYRIWKDKQTKSQKPA